MIEKSVNYGNINIRIVNLQTQKYHLLMRQMIAVRRFIHIHHDMQTTCTDRVQIFSMNPEKFGQTIICATNSGAYVKFIAYCLPHVNARTYPNRRQTVIQCLYPRTVSHMLPAQPTHSHSPHGGGLGSCALCHLVEISRFHRSR